MWRRTGKYPVIAADADSVSGFLGRVAGSYTFLTVISTVWFAVSPSSYADAVPGFGLLEKGILRWVGVVAIAVGGVLCAVAQAQMGDSWRLGIDPTERTALVNKGLFRISRNPIYLGILAYLIGLFLALPNALNLFILGLAYVTLQTHVRVEEEHLARLHGAVFASNYRSRVPRWL